jgi:hypothetical protein
MKCAMIWARKCRDQLLQKFIDCSHKHNHASAFGCDSSIAAGERKSVKNGWGWRNGLMVRYSNHCRWHYVVRKCDGVFAEAIEAIIYFII